LIELTNSLSERYSLYYYSDKTVHLRFCPISRVCGRATGLVELWLADSVLVTAAGLCGFEYLLRNWCCTLGCRYDWFL